MREDLGDYSSVNAAWGTEPIPRLDGEEAIRAVKRLYRRWIGQAWSGGWTLTSGRRSTWALPDGTFRVNPQSWRRLIHDVSHYCHRQLNPGADDHDAAHAVIEFEMIEFVKASGWLAGKLKPKAAAPADPIRSRYAAVLRRIERWTAKERRAATALRKLRRQRAYYEKRFARERPAGRKA